ncbi:MAG: HYR domain-containing protein, partial [Acidimicrobiia bacterium]
METTSATTSTSGTDTSGTTWSDINQVVLFGGPFGAGSNVQFADLTERSHPSAWTRWYPSGTDTINWARFDAEASGLQTTVHTVYVIEWGSEWNVQRAYVTGNVGGGGADFTTEYNTATITSVVRDNTWVWGTGYTQMNSIGEGAEGQLVTLGDGVTQNANETQVAVGSEYNLRSRDFDVYVMTHPNLAVDYRFKVDGDTAVFTFPVTVDSASAGSRMGWVTNGQNGTGDAHPRPIFSARYTADTIVTIERARQGQPFPAWVQGIDFSGVTSAVTAPDKVTGLTATPVGSQIDLSWTGGSAITGYQIERRTCAGTWAPLVPDTGSTAVTYSDTMVAAATCYGYRVSAINAIGTGTASTEATVTTPPVGPADTVPPVPDPMTWATVPSPTGSSSIAMTATTASDPNGVEYSFMCTLGGCRDSGWQDSAIYVDTGLQPGTQYTYQVKARDKSANQNETGWSSTASATTESVGTGVKLDHGVVSGVGSSWTDVNLTESYNSMVVVATANYDGSSGPAVVRIQNASGSSFQVSVVAFGGPPPIGLDVHYVVVEAGVYTEAQHGVKMEAVKFLSTVTDENNSWVGESRTYVNTYNNPVVLGQVMSANDPDVSIFWSRGTSRSNPPSASTLWVGKHVGEDPLTTRADETVGYIVVEAGTGTVNGQPFLAAVGGDTVRGMDNGPPFSYSLTGLPTATTAIVTLTGMDGGDGGWAILYGPNPVSSSSLNLAIDEDQLGNTERGHTTEQVAYIVFATSAPPAVPPGADTTPPVVSVPADITAEATGPSGAVVTFVSSANDAVDGSLTPTCAPASGSTFALGTTTVTCSATDTAGNMGTASFSVTVQDTTPPAGVNQAPVITSTPV